MATALLSDTGLNIDFCLISKRVIELNQPLTKRKITIGITKGDIIAQRQVL